MSIFDESIDRGGTYSVQYDERVNKFGTDDLLPLWVADMDLPSPKCITEALVRRASHPLYGYTIYPERFYKAIAGWMKRRHGWKIEREAIVPIPGVVPALNLIVEAFSEPEEGVLIQPPVYHPFFRLGRHHGRKLLQNPLVLENGRYTIDFDDFRKKAKEAKLFVLCSPHNPVGRVWSEEELKEMASICLEEEVLIVSDEVHADIVYPPHRHIPVASLDESVANITITLNAPSKTFNIAGLNTAYAITENDSLRRRLAGAVGRYELNMGNLFGIEALMAAYEGGEEWLNELLLHLKGNMDYAIKSLQKETPSIRAVEAEATYLLWLDCRDLGMEDKELADFFVKKAKLGLNSGISFGKEGSGFMRMNIACSKKKLQEAVKRLKEAL